MKQKLVLFLMLPALMTAGDAFAQQQYYLSQIANGAASGGTFRTTFILVNNTAADLTASVKLTDDGGNPLTLTIQGLGARNEFDVFIPAGGTRVLQTDGSDQLVTGAATVTAPGGIGVSAIFSLYDGNGNFITEAGVGSSELLNDFVVPVDTTGQFNTGLALFNPGGSSTNVGLKLRNTEGTPVDQTTEPLSGGNHRAIFVAGDNQLFPNSSGFRGTLSVHSDQPIAALVLRQNQEPLSYTSLPAVPAGSTKTTLNLAQVANGSFGGGTFKTTFILFNLASASTEVTLSLTNDKGAALPVTIQGFPTASTFPIHLNPGGSAFLQTDGAGTLTAGAATITASAPIGASGIFTVSDAGGGFETEAGVGDSPVFTALTLPVDTAPGSDTGVAFFNPAAAGVRLDIKLLDASGKLFDPGTSLDLDAMGHTAQFVSQLFPGAGTFRGSLTVLAPTGVAAVTLRQNTAPLSYTTLPAVSGAFAGTAPPEPLLPATQSGIAAGGDVVINQTLAPGFRLTGHIAGSSSISEVTALRSDGKVYTGVFDPDTGRYLAAVDQGTYTLQVVYQVVDVSGLSTVSLTYQDPRAVVVNQDTTWHIVLPFPQVYSVSGTVSGLSFPIAPYGSPQPSIVFTSPDKGIEGVFPLLAGGAYSGSLPNGSYQASVIASLTFTQFQNQELALYDLGSVSVNGSPVNADFAIPQTVTISGTVRASWFTSSSPAFGIQIRASDLSAPAASETNAFTPPSTNIAGAEPFSGQYQMILTRGRSYDLGLTMPYIDNSKRLGTLSFSLQPSPFTPETSQPLFDFTLPNLPATATIHGKIAGSQGIGLAGMVVTASTQSVSGASGTGFSATTSTDANGNYSLTVLSGTGYQLQVLPPTPLP